MAENFEEALASLQRKMEFVLERMTELEQRISKLEGRPIRKEAFPPSPPTEHKHSHGYLMRTIASVKKKYESR